VTVSLSAGLVLVVAALLVPAAPAAASEFIDRGATSASLSVTSTSAVVTYRAGGATKRVLASGAINARAPNGSVPQVKFRITTGAALPPGGSCGPYDGPALRWRVAPCKAPDGSYWGLQSWPRLLPNFGAKPASFEQSARELRLSHWRGPIAELEIKTDWAWRRFDHLYGRLTYLGKPVHGFRTTRYGARRSTATAATSTSIRSIRDTAAAGSARTASSPTAPPESSATWSARAGEESVTGPRSSAPG
jgi:hypothetical protein